jgi:GAF domain-containing protein
MQNLRDRAERLAGSCTWESISPHGTRVTWRAPFRSPTPDASSATVIGKPVETALLACSRILATAPPREALGRICRVAGDMLGADHVSVGVAEGENMRLAHAWGLPGDANPRGLLIPRESSVSGLVMDSRQPLKIDSMADLPIAKRLFGKLPYGPAILVPLIAQDEAVGTFVCARRKGEAPFSRAELEQAEVMSLFVRLAVELLPPDEVDD